MILLYHKVFPDSPSMWWVEVDDFYRQMADLYGKKVVYLDEYDPADKDHVVITFDGVYDNVLKFAAPILKHFGYPFELFVVGDYVGKDNAFDTVEPRTGFAGIDGLERMVRMGGRLQWHSRSHRDLSRVKDADELEAELSVSQELRELDPSGFKWLAFPHGVFSPHVLDAARKRFMGAVSCDQGDDGRYCLKRLTVTNSSRFSTTRVAVIIASYNYGRFLAEAIESVLRQTIPPDEILIADDCSEDSTAEIGSDYALRYPGLIKYHRNFKNLGIVGSFNNAVGMTNSDYLIILGADNRILSNYVEECKRGIESSDKIAVAYTDFAFFGPRARIEYERFHSDFHGGEKEGFFLVNFPEWNAYSREELKVRNFMHGSSMFRRDAFKRVGGYRESAGRAEDRDLFSRMASDGWAAKKVKKTLLEYRQHSTEQANLLRGTHSELLHYKEKCKKLLHEQEIVRSVLDYKLVALLVFFEKVRCYLRENGWKASVCRAKTYIREKIL